MTRKIFWSNPYETVHETVVTSVSGPDVTLKSTIFFAFSGGQESDHGKIGGFPVVSARKDGFEIIYTLVSDHLLSAGQAVQVQIDWERRYRLMRLHFAAEIVLYLFYKRLQGVEKVGAHIARDKARLDFALQESISPMLPEFSEEANRIIEADLPVRSEFEDEANERRYWEIEGISRVPCGGTHIKRTGEIGTVRLKRNNIGRGRERVEIYLIS